MKKGIWLALLAVVLTAVIIVLPVAQSELTQKKTPASSAVEKLNRNIIGGSDKEPLKTKNGSTEVRDETVTYFVLLSESPLIDRALSSGRYGSVRELILSADGKSACDAVRKSQAVAKASIKKLVPEAVLDGGRIYSALFNGVTVSAPAAAKEKLEKIKGVSAVYALKDDGELFDNDSSESKLSPAAINAEKLTQAQRASSGLDSELLSEYRGSGSLIAVIDSGFDTNADVFSQYPETEGMSPSVISELNKRISFNTASDTVAASVYLSPKIVFAYDYADSDNDTGGEYAFHGTAAASIAAGNNGDAAEIYYRGAACDAQLALMKTAGTNGRIITSAFLAALDDAVKLGADIVNIGFGSYRLSGLSGLLGYAFEKMRDTGMTVIAAAGNGKYNGSYTGEKPDAADIFYSAENTLSTGGGVISAASLENTVAVKRFVTFGGVKLYYTDLCSKKLTDSVRMVENIGTILGAAENKAQYNEYIYADGFGGDGLFPDIAAEDRMIVLDASKTDADDISEICRAAAEKGAVSVALAGPAKDELPLFDGEIPAVRLEGADTAVFASDREGTFTIDLDGEVAGKENAPSVSDFTSYGVSDDLDMGARITAVGEDILAANADGGFELVTGTSASAPIVSGAYAVLKQYIAGMDGLVTGGQSVTELARAVMLSSSSPIKYGAEGTLYYSPRLQGFGTLDLKNALAVQAHFYDPAGLSSVSLGDGESNSLSFSFTLCNDAAEPRKFTLLCAVQTDRAEADSTGRIINTLEPMSLSDVSAVTFYSGDEAVTEVEIGAGMSADITVGISIDEGALGKIKEAFTAGFYIEGFVFAKAESGSISLPYMRFYGELENSRIFDSTLYDDEASVTGQEGCLAAAAYKNGEPASCELVMYDGRLLFSTEAVRSFKDDTAYGSAAILPDIYLLCNAYYLTIRVYDASEKLLITENVGELSSHRYAGSRPYEELSLSKSFREFFSKLPRGRYRYEIGAKRMLADGLLSMEKTVSFIFELDNLKPEGVSAQTVSESGRLYLELTASDSGGIRGFELYCAAYDSKNDSYSYIDSLDSIIEAGYISAGAYSFVDKRVNEDGSFTFRYDITDLSGELRKLTVNTDNWQISYIYKKIAYKAIDNAGNPSEVRLADAIEYGSAEFIFTDSSGRPARNIGVRIGKSMIYSDSMGRAFFEKVEPNYYNAQLYYDTSVYSIDRSGYLVSITRDKLEYRIEQTVEFLGTYPEDNNGDTVVAEKTRADTFAEEQDRDEPAVAFVFVGSVLIVCVMLFSLRKIKDIRSK